MLSPFPHVNLTEETHFDVRIYEDIKIKPRLNTLSSPLSSHKYCLSYVSLSHISSQCPVKHANLCFQRYSWILHPRLRALPSISYLPFLPQTHTDSFQIQRTMALIPCFRFDFQDDILLSESSHFTFVYDDNECSLVVLNTQADDSGVYTCTAKNLAGSVSCKAELTVHTSKHLYVNKLVMFMSTFIVPNFFNEEGCLEYAASTLL